MILATRFTFIVERSWKNMYFHPKLAWPPATYDVISRNHSNWPSLKLSQNLCEGWTNSYAGSWCFILYKKKKEEKPYGGWDPPPPHVLARFKFKPKWTSMWKRIVSSKAIRINGVCLFTFSDRKDARLRFSLSTNAFDKHSSTFPASIDLGNLTFHFWRTDLGYHPG